MSLDTRYDFSIIVASKVIIRKSDSILLTREPKDHTWMPGRLGLPGGKFYLHEDILEGTKRKIREEAGVECNLVGLFRIIDILMPDKTVYHFIFIADWVSGELNTAGKYSAELRWFTREEALALSSNQVTEYYLPEIFKGYYESPQTIFPIEFFSILRSFEDKEIQNWMKRGKKEQG